MGISGLLASSPEKWVTLPVLVVAGMSVLLIQSLWSWYRLSHVPGPRLHGLSLIPMLRSQLSGEVHLLIKDWSGKYGKNHPVAPDEGLSGRKIFPPNKKELPRSSRPCRSQRRDHKRREEHGEDIRVQIPLQQRRLVPPHAFVSLNPSGHAPRMSSLLLNKTGTAI